MTRKVLPDGEGLRRLGKGNPRQENGGKGEEGGKRRGRRLYLLDTRTRAWKPLVLITMTDALSAPRA